MPARTEENHGGSGGGENHQSKGQIREQRIGEAYDPLDEPEQKHAHDPDDIYDRESTDVRMPIQARRAVFLSAHHGQC